MPLSLFGRCHESNRELFGLMPLFGRCHKSNRELCRSTCLRHCLELARFASAEQPVDAHVGVPRGLPMVRIELCDARRLCRTREHMQDRHLQSAPDAGEKRCRRLGEKSGEPGG